MHHRSHLPRNIFESQFVDMIQPSIAAVITSRPPGIRRCVILSVFFLLGTWSTLVAGELIDGINFADPNSEQQHNFRTTGETRVVENSEIDGTAGRSILPPEEGYVNEEEKKLWGHSMFITLKVHPRRRNYFTARFWGGVKDWRGRLALLANGKLLTQTGHGSFEPLVKSIGRTGAPPFPGRFFYSTTPLPLELTRGREKIQLEIRHFGRFYRYKPGTLKKPGLYWPVKEPSRAIYRVYTHVGPYFSPPENEKQGEKPPMPDFLSKEVFKRKKKAFGKQLKKQVYDKVKNEIKKLENDKSFNERWLLRVYDMKWTPFYRDERIAKHSRRFIREIDQRVADGNFNQVRGNPGEGIAKDFLKVYTFFDVDEYLNETVRLGDEKEKRRRFYADAFVQAQKSGLSGRNTYTNQADWSDGGIYPMNRCLQILAPNWAMPERMARRIELEMIGLKPHSGNWVTDGSPERTPPDGALETASFKIYTDKGQGRERGYVANYGEMQGTVASRAQLFDHDPDMKKLILEQAHKVLKGRTYFRYPHWDENGNRTVRTESVIGSRYALYPGRGGYKHGYSGIDIVWLMEGNELAQRLTHRIALDGRLFDRDLNHIVFLAGFHYYNKWLKQQDRFPAPMKFPVEGDNFVWADEQNGVVVFKRGDARAWVNFMFRNPGGSGVNDVARIHYTTSEIDRLATVRTSSKVREVQRTFTLHPHAQYADNQEPGSPYATIPGLENYRAGEEWPVAKGKAGGKADFFAGRYGNYLIFMNTTKDQTFPVDLSSMVRSGKRVLDVGRGTVMRVDRGDAPKKLPPRSTVVLYIEPN